MTTRREILSAAALAWPLSLTIKMAQANESEDANGLADFLNQQRIAMARIHLIHQGFGRIALVLYGFHQLLFSNPLSIQPDHQVGKRTDQCQYNRG